MLSVRERVMELRTLRQQQPEVPMLPIGIPKRMAVVLGVMAALLLLQIWTKRHVGRGAGAEGGGVTSHAESSLTTAAPSQGLVKGASPYRVYYAPGDDLSGMDVTLVSSAAKTLDVAAAGELDDRLCRAIGLVARRGTVVRVLRDASSFSKEKDRAGGSCSEGLASIGVAVRVLVGPMDLHSFAVDGALLRGGTAGFGGRSAQGAEEMSVVRSSDAVVDFERTFSGLWNEPDDRVVRGAQ